MIRLPSGVNQAVAGAKRFGIRGAIGLAILGTATAIAHPGSKPVVAHLRIEPQFQHVLTDPAHADFVCNNVTHIVYQVSPTVSADGSITVSEANRALLANAVAIAHARGVKVLIVTYSLSNIIQSATARAKFVTEILQFCQDNNVDGINSDWETPTAEESPYFTQLMKELRAAARQRNN